MWAFPAKIKTYNGLCVHVNSLARVFVPTVVATRRGGQRRDALERGGSNDGAP